MEKVYIKVELTPQGIKEASALLAKLATLTSAPAAATSKEAQPAPTASAPKAQPAPTLTAQPAPQPQNAGIAGIDQELILRIRETIDRLGGNVKPVQELLRAYGANKVIDLSAHEQSEFFEKLLSL